MIIVNFDSEKDTYKTVTGLWQWDYGQKLHIQGLKLPAAVEIHFSLLRSGGEAVTRIGVTRDGVTDVVIPDSMLENGNKSMDYYIYAFIYLSDAESGQTEYRISMPVRSRPKPETYREPEAAEIFREAITAVNAAADRVEEGNRSAEAWAHGREDYPERAEDNAAYYAAESRKSAELSEQAAEKSGYMQFSIEDGRLVETVTDNVGVEFTMEEGRLYLL